MNFADKPDDRAGSYSQEGTTLLLPARVLPKSRQIGWAVIACGTAMLSFLVGWMAVPITIGASFILAGHAIGWFAVGFGLLGMTGLRTGLRILLAGIALGRNRLWCSLEVRDGRLFCVEHLGWLTWSRSCDVKGISSLQISRARKLMDKGDADITSEQWLGTHTHAIAALDDAGNRLLALAPGYPPERLERAADDLKRLVESERLLVGERARIRVKLDNDANETGGPDSATEGLGGVIFQMRGPLIPPGTDIGLQRRGDGITISVPPAGLKKGPKGLFGMALAWNAFCAFILCLVVSRAIGLIDHAHGSSTLTLLLIMTPFELIGVILLLTALNMARRSAAIATAGDRLLIVSKSIFGQKKAEWRAEDISQIRVWPSGMSVNDQPVMELQVWSGGAKFGCLSQRATDELCWVAYELNEALSIGEQEALAS